VKSVRNWDIYVVVDVKVLRLPPSDGCAVAQMTQCQSAPKCGAGLCNSPDTEKYGVGKKGRKRRKRENPSPIMR
jgi:hypothetical protein